MFHMDSRIQASFSGEYCCRNDHSMTLVSDPGQLAGIFGYSEEEMREICQIGFQGLIEEETRDTWHQKLVNQLQKKGEVELVFPVIRKDGSSLWLMNRGRRVEIEGQEYIFGILVDITETKQQYDREREVASVLHEQARKDSLTNIYNASTARKLAEEYLAEDGMTESCALLIIDLDDFKSVNDTHGHLCGDALLVQAAQAIRRLFRSKDIVGRIGGDEFMVLMKNVSDKELVKNRCLQLNEILQNIFKGQLGVVDASCSIGVSFSPEHGYSYFSLFCCADQALYHAKQNGRKQHVFYEEGVCGATRSGSAMQYANYDVNVLKGYIE